MANRIALTLILLFYVISLSAQNKSEAETKGLAVGMKAPDFELLNQDSLLFDSKKALKNGPLLVLFYRGQWCPYCNKHLSSINDSLSLLLSKGITVIAVSPEKPSYLRAMRDKTGAQNTFLFDENYRLAAAFDVLYDPGETLKERYNKRLNARLAEAHDDERALLPVPASFLIDSNGVIIWRHFEHDYKNRSSVAEILKKIK
jgi:peroxiredoxin